MSSALTSASCARRLFRMRRRKPRTALGRHSETRRRTSIWSRRGCHWPLVWLGPLLVTVSMQPYCRVSTTLPSGTPTGMVLHPRSPATPMSSPGLTACRPTLHPLSLLPPVLFLRTLTTHPLPSRATLYPA